MTDDPMPSVSPEPRGFSFNLRGNLIAGVLTVIPLFAVWFVLDLLYSLLSDLGVPWIRTFAAWLSPAWPELAEMLVLPGVLSAIAVIVVLLLLYLIGLLATFVVGQQIIGWFEDKVLRIPVVQTIYRSAKQLVQALQTKPASGQRVVMIEFPHPGMHAIGFITKTMRDVHSGQDLAAVYVPTTPNPTSGYLELVPIDKLIATDLTMDQAMTMIISGGAVAPDSFAAGPKPLQPKGS